MNDHYILTFTFSDECSAAGFNAWFAAFLGRLESDGAPMEAAFIHTRFDDGCVTKLIEFDSACDLHRAVNADIAGQVAALKRNAIRCACY